MIPLKITAHLLTGKIATGDLYLPLDSMMAYVWMTEEHPERMVASASGISPEELIEEELPLEKRGEGDGWYWAASFACGEPIREEILYWHKRFDFDLGSKYVDFGKRRGKVDVKAGLYKNHRMPMITYLLPKLDWYAVGDKAEVERMIRQITHIGKNRSQGFGRVTEWTVEEWPEDLSHLRAIPDPDGEYEMGVRSPYWLACRKRRTKLSGDRRLACNAQI